jgi:GntR family transcriptional regulator
MMKNAAGVVKLNAKGGLLHRQLFLLLRQEIVSGRYRHGDRLPTQDELCRRFAVSRITVRRALADLQAEGLIRNEQGAGAFVTAPPAAGPSMRPIGFVDEMQRVLDETTMRIVSMEQSRCPAAIAAALGLGEEDEALHLLRTRSRDGVPVLLLDAWIPPRSSAAVSAKALRTAPLFQLVSGGADRLGRVVQEVSAALADPIVAQALDIDVNDAALKVVRLMHDRTNVPIMHLTIWSSPRRTRLVTEVDAEALNTLGTGRLLHDVPPENAPRRSARKSRS